MIKLKQIVSVSLSWLLVLFTVQEGFAFQNPPYQEPPPYQQQPPYQQPPPGQNPPYTGQPPQGPPQALTQTPQQLQQLVAPIALYPDQLIAQILAASTYPTQIVDAQRWMNDHRNLQGQALGDAVNAQPWDPSVKALTQFPQVLANMNQNLAWTSELGDAYINQPQDVSNAIQFMRQQAQRAGNLRPTPQENVTNEGNNIEIVPAQPDYVYVPQYDPWLVYGYPLAPFPDWYPYPGLYIAGPGIGFGLGFGLGFFGGFAWGWPHWGWDWHGGGRVFFNHNTFISHSPSIVNRGAFRAGGFDRGGVDRGGFDRGGADRGGFDRGGADRGGVDRGGADRGGFRGETGVGRGSGGMRTGAFSNFNHGAVARSNSFRGQSSFGGSHGGGGFHGGGGRR